MDEVQTRSDGGDLQYFATIGAALRYADSHPDVWKISWPEGDQHVRLVRRQGLWAYEPILGEILESIGQLLHGDPDATSVTLIDGASFIEAELNLPETKRITRNAARCDTCGDVIESKYRHDFHTCQCGNLSVDGGLDYTKRALTPGAEWTDLTETEDS